MKLPFCNNHFFGRIVFLLLLCSFPYGMFSQTQVDSESAKSYILSCQKPNGAFGPKDMEYTDVAWTYPAVHALNLLGVKVPSPDSCYINGGKSFMEKAGWKNGPWYWSLHQKANLYELLGKSGSLEGKFPEGISLSLNFQSRRNYLEPRRYAEGMFFDMASMWHLTDAIYILKGSVKNQKEITDYIVSRQTPSGGFDDMLGNRKIPIDEKAHIIVTYNAVMTLNAMNYTFPEKEKIIDWVQSCQSPGGGFRWNPDNESNSNQPDVWYTWAAIKMLKLLGDSLQDQKTSLNWLNSLQNADGGFGDRPGWNSRLYSTYYSIDAIEMLTGNVNAGITDKKMEIKAKEIPEGYSIFQAQHKTPAGGTEMVDAIAAMKLNFIGVKTTEKEVIQSEGMSETVKKARRYADEKGYPLEIVDCPENYAHRLVWFSGMNGDHVSNLPIPPDLTEVEKENYLQLYNEGLKRHPWNEFKEKVIEPALKLNTLFYPELDFTMMNAYMVYDEGLDGHTGYNAVPAAHFNNIDWVRHFPYKERWLGQLPMIADGDAHGDIEKWKPNLEMFRNVFIAKSYKFKDYIDASLNGRTVCVIKMPESNEVRYYGSDEAVNYLKNHLNEWKWW